MCRVQRITCWQTKTGCDNKIEEFMFSDRKAAEDFVFNTETQKLQHMLDTWKDFTNQQIYVTTKKHQNGYGDIIDFYVEKGSNLILTISYLIQF